MSIKALLLAAGYGTRLKPITEELPKCLVEIGGKPIIRNWINKLDRIGCSEIIINTHYLHKQVDSYIESMKEIEIRAKCKLSYEKVLLGTGGSLYKHKNKLRGGLGIVIHVDNATNMELDGLINMHLNRKEGCIMTMLTFNTDNPRECGIVEVDDNGIVIGFYEKQDSPPGNRANAAVYVFDDGLIDFIEQSNLTINDISTQLIPLLSGKIQTFHTDEEYIDIGTHKDLERARSYFKSNT